ncbi:MAG: T9SS C-terminal target domain-containing protein [Calditrichaeota bacterium]|nr:MAG: T9SS C-terminal target domain-containing protein [Calditrichota bacterium]
MEVLRRRILWLVVCCVFGLPLLAQNTLIPPPLSTLPIPEPPNLMDFVKDRDAAIRLGKAFFWDMQVGSDGIQACASCHFHAGADTRTKNQLSPHGPPPATNPADVFEVAGPNGELMPGHFPFHRLADPEDQESAVLFDTDDVAGAQGVINGTFNDILPGIAEEDVTYVSDPVFAVGGVNTRRVTPRNAPSVINAVFNIENFWDGRAKFLFNGVNPFGALDPDACILEKQPDGSVIPVSVLIERSSLASQAVGPPLSDFEMSGAARTFPKLAKKLLSLTPLAKQLVDPTDSVLGPYSRYPDRGIVGTYAGMIQAAFQDKYWDSDKLFNIDKVEIGSGAPSSTDEYTLMEMNFTLFWGLAIQMYESTLVSDDTPFDRYQAGDTHAMTPAQLMGLNIFIKQGRCIACHSGPEFTAATVDQRIDNPFEPPNPFDPIPDPVGFEAIIERMPMADGGVALYDGGFYNIGVRPTAEDIGRGGYAPSGLPISFSKFAPLVADSAEFHARQGVPPGIDIPLEAAARKAVDGSFKTPSLRNVELTGPYFHNGSEATLRDVVLFYTRGGNFAAENAANLALIFPIGHLKGKPHRQRLLAAFMTALTDDRVRYQRAPFDHPEIFIPHGHVGDELLVSADPTTGNGEDEFLHLPAVGAAGSATPLTTFLGLDPLGPAAPDVNDRIVLFATNSIKLRQGVDVRDGDIVVNDVAPGATLYPGAELLVGKRVVLPILSNTVANRIVVKADAVIPSTIIYNSLNAAGSATLAGAQGTSLSLPVISTPALPPFHSGTPGTTDISIPDFGTMTITPGDYGDIYVGYGARLDFEPGTYNIRNLTVGFDFGSGWASLVFNGPAEVRVAERMNIGKNVFVGNLFAENFELGGPVCACGIVFYVAGTNGVSGGIEEDPLAVRIGNRSIIEANIYAPNGTLKIGKYADVTGSFIARDIDVAKHAVVDLDSHFEFGEFLPLPKAGSSGSDNDGVLANAPNSFELHQNFPNPFNPTTTIRFALPEANLVTVEIYNIMGQKVKTLISDNLEAGYHQVVWDATNDHGNKVASGIYIYRMKAGAFTEVKKMTLLK